MVSNIIFDFQNEILKKQIQKKFKKKIIKMFEFKKYNSKT